MTAISRPRSVTHRFATLEEHASAAADLVFERGSVLDYRRLARFHYRSHHPGVVSAVFRVVDRRPTVVGRYRRHRGERNVVGVLVRALPRLSCRLRDVALRRRYSSLPAADGGRLLNREMRIISRVVIDPRWRGAGVAVRLVRHALAHPETIFTEALATMGRVHPFFARAGMIAYDLPPHEAHVRLTEALARLGLEPRHLASPRVVRETLESRAAADAAWFEHELRRWQQAICPSACRLRRPPRETLLVLARQRLLAHPVYYLFDHRGITTESHGGPRRGEPDNHRDAEAQRKAEGERMKDEDRR